MAEKTILKPEIAAQKKVLKLPPAIGDWTTYRPPQVLVKKVKSGLYGFDRLSQDELSLALKIHYTFIQALLRRLRVDLGIGVEFTTCQIEQTTYLNFLRSLAGAVVQCRLNLENLHDNIQSYFDLNLASSVINHALGSHDLEPLTRGLTDAEGGVFQTALAAYLPAYAAAFAGAFPTPELRLIGSPDVTLDPSVSTTATFVVFTAEVSFNDNPAGKIVFGYPGNSLKTMLKLAEARTALLPLDFSRLSGTLLAKIPVPLRALLGKTYLSTTELGRLEVGDVVSLDALLNAPIDLQVGREVKLPGQPVVSGRKRAVRLAGAGLDRALRPAPVAVAELPSPKQAAAEPEEVRPAEEPAAVEDVISDEDFNEDDFNLDDLNLGPNETPQ
ncbi:MAG: FliM/FliN family flagellar motor switch protein [Candidatus Margulisbacteria bacterium]|jgi:flagellar motor switch protein FliM|nr:FliM/FliN family flagellar motor switch protein [Candidatus Margulisiibacteriota bacterium]